MRVRFQPKQYGLTMTGSKYSYAITQLETATGSPRPGLPHVCPRGFLPI